MQTPKRVLIAEDDRFLRRACEVSLKQLGLVVVSARDGAEALEMINAQAPDLILLDLLMPKLTGLEVLRSLKANENTKSIPVLILTNSSRSEDIEKVMGLGAVGYQVKANMSLEDLSRQVTQLLKE